MDNKEKVNLTRFNLSGKVALITGGGGLLGPEHGIALANCGATVVLIDVNEEGLQKAYERVIDQLPEAHLKTVLVDITEEAALINLKEQLEGDELKIDILVNNAAINPKMDKLSGNISGTVENYDMDMWNRELNVGITGTFLCCKIFGHAMALHGGGTIVNIASDLAIQGPDQRVYSNTGRIEDVEHFKPIGYSVVKSAMLGITRYLATYWAHKGIRVNCLVPGGVFNNQPESLVQKVSECVPLGRMAIKSEYQEAIAFLASDASSYMTGQMLVMDGGRSVW
jgi:NAD(P)-dependent dehydrogenase (short-subunit alcohol dehydrogenase family)